MIKKKSRAYLDWLYKYWNAKCFEVPGVISITTFAIENISVKALLVRRWLNMLTNPLNATGGAVLAPMLQKCDSVTLGRHLTA